MSTSKQPPGGSSYARFIPREELKGFSAWNPASLESPGSTRPAPGESPAGGGVHKAPFASRVAQQEGDTAVAAKPAAPRAAAPAGASAAGQAGARSHEEPLVPTRAGSPAPHPAARPAGPASAPAMAQAPSAKAGAHSGSTAAAPEPAQPATPPEPTVPQAQVDVLVKESRQSGYQDGYRDGLAALESYKATQSAQMAAFMSDQVGAMVADLHQRLEQLEAQLSGRIAGVALELARQVVRSEITQRPELIVQVAEDAMAALLASARDVTLRMNPEDLRVAQGSLEDALATRGARAVADPHVAPGGCVVESDIAVVDASVQARWGRAAAAMGSAMPWEERQGSRAAPAAATPSAAPTADDDDLTWDDLDAIDPPPSTGDAP
jgi:flagellar assembly protein FliH